MLRRVDGGGHRSRSAFRNLRQDGGRNFLTLQDHSAFAFNPLHFTAFGAGAKGGRRAFLSGAASAADAMDEVIRSLRQIEVDDVRHAINVYAAGSHVGGNQYAVTTITETGQRLIALILGTISVHSDRLDAGSGQAFGQPVGTVLGAGENEERTFFERQHMAQKIDFVIAFHFIETEFNLIGRLRNGLLNGDTNWFFRELVNQAFHGFLMVADPIIFLSTMILFHSFGVSVSAADPLDLGERWSGRNEYQWSSWGNSGQFSLLVPTSRLNAFAGFNA